MRCAKKGLIHISHKQAIAAEREKVISGLRLCEDRSLDKALTIRLRQIQKEVTAGKITSLERCREMVGILEELNPSIAKNKSEMVELLLSRLATLAKEIHEKTDEGGIIMSIIEFLKKLFGIKTRDKDLGDVKGEAEKAVYALERKIMSLSSDRKDLLKQIESKVSDCVALSPDSTEYKLASMKAKSIRDQIKGIDGTIERYARLLQDNIKYKEMIQAGIDNFDINQFIPDPAEADRLMSSIANQAAIIEDKMSMMEDAISSNSEAIGQSYGASVLQADDEFDALVRQKRQNKQEAMDARIMHAQAMAEQEEARRAAAARAAIESAKATPVPHYMTPPIEEPLYPSSEKENKSKGELV